MGEESSKPSPAEDGEAEIGKGRNDIFILANDEGQAADDLGLAKKLVAVNPIIARSLAKMIHKSGFSALRRPPISCATSLTFATVVGSSVSGIVKNCGAWGSIAPPITFDSIAPLPSAAEKFTDRLGDDGVRQDNRYVEHGERVAVPLGKPDAAISKPASPGTRQ